MIEDRSKILQPRQVGVGVAGGAEAVIHDTRRYISQLPSGHAFIKLDFANAFNTLRRDLFLDTVARNTPELYRFTLATYECDPTLVYGSHTIPSREGPQQSDPLSSLEFCESIQPILNELDSDLEIGFIDDLSMSSDLLKLAKDFETIIKAETSTGLKLNTTKCEIIMDDFTILDFFPIFKDLIRVPKDKMTLLGAPILQGEALDEALQIKVDELQKAINRLKLLWTHDALVHLKNIISIPKLLYLLRISNCYNHPLLLQFDIILKSGLSTILNVDFDETQ